MSKKFVVFFLVAVMLLMSTLPVAAATKGMIGINVVLKTDITNAILTELGTHGKVRDVIYEIDALTMQVKAGKLATIRALPFVATANPDAVRNGAPVDTVADPDFSDGISTWDLDAINVADFGAGRVIGLRWCRCLCGCP